jgi:hypothetical protein
MAGSAPAIRLFGGRSFCLEHFQEKWKPVFRFENATTQEALESVSMETERTLSAKKCMMSVPID